MKYRPALTVKRGRLSVVVHTNSLNLPRLHFYADGDCVTVGGSYGNGNSDALLLVDVDLSGTRIGRMLAAVYWWLQDRKGHDR